MGYFVVATVRYPPHPFGRLAMREGKGRPDPSGCVCTGLRLGSQHQAQPVRTRLLMLRPRKRALPGPSHIRRAARTTLNPTATASA